MNRIRVLVVDDHEVVRLGVKALIDCNPDMTVVAEAGTAQEAMLMTKQHEPDVVLLDIRLPDGNGLEVCRDIRRSLPDTHVVVLTSYLSDDLIGRALQAGASGYVLKELGNEELLRAIRSAVRGEVALDPRSSSHLVRRLRELESHQTAPAFKDLSPREIDVLKVLAEGKSNREIGSALDLREATVRNYVSSILEKLALRNRVELALFATEHRITGDPDQKQI